MTGGQQYSTRGLHLPNDMTRSWCAEDTVLTKDQLLDSIRSPDLRNQLHNLGVVVAAVAGNDQKAAIDALRN